MESSNKDNKKKVIIKRSSLIFKSNDDITTRYEILKKIGGGAFGTVYKVKNKETEQVCAMKQITKSLIPNMDKFKSEIQIMSILDHPNILRLLEVFENDEYFYLLLEFCDGGELLDKIKIKPLKEKEAAKIFNQIISAVHYIHQNGVCHRDLKPENILFATKDEDSPIKIIDFGLSYRFKNNEESESLLPSENLPIEIENEDKFKKMPFRRMKSKVGTLYYLSPEIIGGSYNEKCDIWSCGVILYILLSGTTPFYGSSDREIYSQISSGKFNFPQNEWKNISKHAKDLISHMLAPEKKRYTAKQVLEDKWLEIKLRSKKSKIGPNYNLLRIKDFMNYNRLKKAVLIFITNRLQEKDIKELRDLFWAFDEFKNGTITFEEFRRVIVSELGEELSSDEEAELKRDFESVDCNHNGKIDFSEFIAANLDEKIFLKEEILRDAFDRFDCDGTGMITKEDIIKMLELDGLEDKDKIATDLIEENDCHKNGKIDFDDFKKMMSKY